MRDFTLILMGLLMLAGLIIILFDASGIETCRVEQDATVLVERCRGLLGLIHRETPLADLY